MANANAHTQLEIYEAMESQIPPVLWVRFRHLSFAEMARQPAGFLENRTAGSRTGVQAVDRVHEGAPKLFPQQIFDAAGQASHKAPFDQPTRKTLKRLLSLPRFCMLSIVAGLDMT